MGTMCAGFGCQNEADGKWKGIPVCAHCRSTKSAEVIMAERAFQRPIADLLKHLIMHYDTWEERYTLLGISKVALFSWVRRYLNKTPQQAVRDLRSNESHGTMNLSLQNGVRDYLQTTAVLLLPE